MRPLAALALIFSSLALAQSHTAFEKRIKAIMSRPEYRHSRFGMEFYSLDQDKVIYAWNPQELFIPGSTTKLLTTGSALELLGPDFRFHTKVYRTGTLTGGVVDGDLVIMASGDPDISNRIRSDGTLAFENEDHSYDGMPAAKPVPGDPLAVLRELAVKVSASGIKKIDGRVRVNTSLFSEGERELGTHVVISPICLNDNLVDVTVTPGREGDSPVLTISPQTGYVTIQNRVMTVAAGGKTELTWKNDVAGPDGRHTVVLAGTIPAGAQPRLRVYKVPTPSRYAEVAFTEVLQSAGIQVGGRETNSELVLKDEYAVAEHTSPPLREAAKVTLKVSQNLHASMLPSIVGAYLSHQADDPKAAGFHAEGDMLRKADLDMAGAAQSDGAGGDALFAPDFMVHFLLHLAKQPFFPDLLKSLPVLGKDGTLFDIQTDSPAAGHVYAKTGTFSAGNALLAGSGVVTGKGLAGFVDTRSGHRLAFAAYINFVPFSEMNNDSTKTGGQALGEIAAAAWEELK